MDGTGERQAEQRKAPEGCQETERALPWRRFLARQIDWELSMLLFAVLYYLLLGCRPGLEADRIAAGVGIAFGVVLTLLAEPVLVTVCATTPGKWLMGLRVHSTQGGRLSYRASRQRTWRALYYGNGCYLPGFHLWRLLTSYQRTQKQERLEWEDGCRVSQKTIGRAAYLAAAVCLLALPAGIRMIRDVAMLPENRGDLTIAEFAENYNAYEISLGIPTDWFLDENGQWYQKKDPKRTYGDLSALGDPVYEYEEADGILTGVTASLYYQGGQAIYSGYQKDLQAAVYAFLCAQEGAGVAVMKRAAGYIEGAGYGSYLFTEAGVRVCCTVTAEGYYYDGSRLIVPEGSTGSFRVEFSMRKE